MPSIEHITATSDSNSTITPSGDVQLGQGNSETFTYSANQGYIIASVLVDGVSVPITGSYIFTNVQTNHTTAVTSQVSGPNDNNEYYTTDDGKTLTEEPTYSNKFKPSVLFPANNDPTTLE